MAIIATLGHLSLLQTLKAHCALIIGRSDTVQVTGPSIWTNFHQESTLFSNIDFFVVNLMIFRKFTVILLAFAAPPPGSPGGKSFEQKILHFFSFWNVSVITSLDSIQDYSCAMIIIDILALHLGLLRPNPFYCE